MARPCAGAISAAVVAGALSGALKPDADELAEIAREYGVGACGLFWEAGQG